ncbi:MAG: S8 family serine peptidase [Planctomycetota bacterium]
MRRALMFLGLLALIAVPLITVSGGSGDKEYSYLVIATADDELPAKLADSISDAGGKLLRSHDKLGIAVAVSSDEDFAEDAAKIKGIRSVIGNMYLPSVLPEGSQRLTKDDLGDDVDPSDDPLHFLQWPLEAIDADGAWDEGYTGAGVIVAVLDTGVAGTHPDLKANVLDEDAISFAYDSDGNLEDWDPTDDVDPLDPYSYFDHGTHVAGIIAAVDNDIGVIGVAPDAKILPVQVLSRDFGYGHFDWIAAGIVYAADNGAHVINLSLGGYLENSGYYDEYEDKTYSAKEVAEALVAMGRAINYAHQKGCVVVAAIGNDAMDLDKDKDGVFSPAEQQHVISVAATGPKGWYEDPDTDLTVPAIFTNYGQSAVDIAAPGGNFDPTKERYWWDWVFGLGVTTDYFWFAAGTSMSAPHVAGVAALVIEAGGGDMKPDQVWSVLKLTSDDLGKKGNDDYYGHGHLNAYEAVK